MRSNRLQPNGDKTEVLSITSVRRQHQLPTLPLTVGGQLVHPVHSVRNLGVFIDADLVMRSHVVRVVSRRFAVLRQLRQVRRYLPPSTFQMLVAALILTRLDYANITLAGLPVHLIRRLRFAPQRRCAGYLRTPVMRPRHGCLTDVTLVEGS
jgi:hypothetical protein